MKKLTYLYLVLLSIPSISYAQLDTLRDVGNRAGFPLTDVKLAIANIIRIVLGFVGTIFLILIIWSGIEWMTSGGNDQKVTAAKKRLVNATIGLVIIVLAYAIAYSVTLWLAEAASGPATSGPVIPGGP